MPTDKDERWSKARKSDLIAEIKRLEHENQAQERVSESGSAAFVSSILNSLPVGIAYLDRDRVYRYANQHYRDLLDKPADSIIGSQMKDVLQPSTYKNARKASEKVLAGTSISFRERLTRGTRVQFLNVSYLPDTAADGAVVGFFAMVHDVTQQHLLEDELAGSERRFQTLVDAVPHGIEEIDIEGNILFANATHHKQYGYEPNELIGMNITELLPSADETDDILRHLKYLVDEQPTPEPYYGKKKKKDGTLIDVKIEWTYKRDINDKVVGFTTVVADVTEQKKAERLQKENADRLELSLKSANIGTFSWDFTKGVNFWDDRTYEIWGLPRGSFQDHKPEDFMNTIHPEDRKRVADAIQNALDDDTPYDIEYRIFRPDGSLAYVQALASVERDRHGQPFKFSGVVLDISERKLIENLKNEFVSTVSHELRTPLTSIRGALGLVSGGALGTIPEDAQDIIRLAEKNALALTKLVNDILDFERAESGKLEFSFERFNLIEFMRENLRSHQGLADRHNVHFRFEPEVSYLELEADVDRLAQVMANLLSNAAKYSPDNGAIDISVRAGGRHVAITVADQGPGIPPEFQDKIFARFSRADASDDRNFGGTGLGLSITKLIIEHHRGNIGFDSSPTQGTRFYFTLPLSQASS